MPVSACARIRLEMARALDGPVETEISVHISECPECALALADLRSGILAISVARSEPPDPGQHYWEEFLPSVLGRLARTPVATQRQPGHRLAVAAALLMMVSAVALLTLPDGGLSGPQEVVSRRLDMLLASTPSRLRIVEDLLNSMEIDREEATGIMLQADFTLEPDDVMDALDDLDALPERPGYLGLWDDRMERFVDRLNADAVAALRAELTRENG